MATSAKRPHGRCARSLKNSVAAVGHLALRLDVAIIDARRDKLMSCDVPEIKSRAVATVIDQTRRARPTKDVGDLGSDLVALQRDRRSEERAYRGGIAEAPKRAGDDAPVQSAPPACTTAKRDEAPSTIKIGMQSATSTARAVIAGVEERVGFARRVRASRVESAAPWICRTMTSRSRPSSRGRRPGGGLRRRDQGRRRRGQPRLSES